MIRDTGLGIGLAMAVPILIGLAVDFIAIGVGAGVVAGVLVAMRWPPQPRGGSANDAGDVAARP